MNSAIAKCQLSDWVTRVGVRLAVNNDLQKKGAIYVLPTE